MRAGGTDGLCLVGVGRTSMFKTGWKTGVKNALFFWVGKPALKNATRLAAHLNPDF